MTEAPTSLSTAANTQAVLALLKLDLSAEQKAFLDRNHFLLVPKRDTAYAGKYDFESCNSPASYDEMLGMLRRVPETLSPEIIGKMGATEVQKNLSLVPECTLDELVAADAILFGTPTRFGNMGRRLASLGYRHVVTRADSPLGPAGTTVRGHEFHYSHLEDDAGRLPGVYALSGRQGDLDVREGFLVGRTLGSYVHLHFGSNPAVADAFVAACAEQA